MKRPKILQSLSRMITIAEKEWIQIRRDTRSLIFALFLPAILILLFGYALSMDVKNVATAVFDQSKTPLSRKFLENFSHTEYLLIKSYMENPKKIDGMINRGKIKMAVIIPPDFEKQSARENRRIFN